MADVARSAPVVEERKLLASDRLDIVEIARHNYAGNDWIVGAFDEKWFAQRDVTLAFVLACPSEAGRVVALEVAELVDEGGTIWLSALRVHPEHQRRGLAHRLQRYIVRMALDLWPSAQQVRYATGDQNPASLRIAGSCGLSASPACNFALFQREDLPEVAARLRAASAPADLQACGDTRGTLLQDVELYPNPPSAVSLGSWKVADLARRTAIGGAVWRSEAGIAYRDDSLPGIRASSLFFSAGGLQENDGMLRMALREVLDTDAAGIGTLHLFTPFSFRELWEKHLTLRTGGEVPGVVMLVHGDRASVEMALREEQCVPAKRQAVAAGSLEESAAAWGAACKRMKVTAP